jgi:hypothetical protein
MAKGWKTLIWNGVLVAGGAVIPWLASVDWTEYVNPTAAVVIVAVVNVGLRMWTTTPMFQKQ